jgi:hypothetical protein
MEKCSKANFLPVPGFSHVPPPHKAFFLGASPPPLTPRDSAERPGIILSQQTQRVPPSSGLRTVNWFLAVLEENRARKPQGFPSETRMTGSGHWDRKPPIFCSSQFCISENGRGGGSGCSRTQLQGGLSWEVGSTFRLCAGPQESPVTSSYYCRLALLQPTYKKAHPTGMKTSSLPHCSDRQTSQRAPREPGGGF